MDPPVDVPATPTRCIFGLFSRVILGRRMRKRKKNKKERKKVYGMFTQLFRQIVYINSVKTRNGSRQPVSEKTEITGIFNNS